MNVEQEVRQYIVDSGRWPGKPEELTADYRLIEEDILDSMEIYSLVAFLEDTYDIVVDARDLVLENLGSLSAIARMVTRIRAAD